MARWSLYPCAVRVQSRPHFLTFLSVACPQSDVQYRASFYDDASWMANALLRSVHLIDCPFSWNDRTVLISRVTLRRFYDITGDGWALDQARGLLSGVIAGWDTSCCGTEPGERENFEASCVQTSESTWLSFISIRPQEVYGGTSSTAKRPRRNMAALPWGSPDSTLPPVITPS
jgi:hypothetical protein